MRRLFWNVVGGYRSKLQTNDVEFGSAFHEFVKIMKQTGDSVRAYDAAQKRFDVPMEVKPEKKYLTTNYLLQTCALFWQHVVSKDQFATVIHPVTKAPMVERKFSVPYFANDRVEILLTGTMDDICKHKHGTYAIRDYKTTSVYKTDLYLSGYRLNPQLLFYHMVIGHYANLYPASIFADITARGFSCFIEGIFLRGATQPVEFKRSELFQFDKGQLDEFKKLVDKKVQELVTIAENWLDNPAAIPPRDGMINGACQTVYGHCKYFLPCSQPDDISCGHMLNRFFIQQEYNPLKFGHEHKKLNENKTLA